MLLNVHSSPDLSAKGESSSADSSKLPLYEANLSQLETPYLTALINYKKTGIALPHLPGHHGSWASPDTVRAITDDAFYYDVAQVPLLGNLYERTGPIGDAQRLSAEAFRCDHVWHLVSGGSGANLVALMAILKDGDKIILPRNSHRSVVGGLIQSGAQPVYIVPEFDEEMGLDLPLGVEQIIDAINQHPDAKAVMVLSPTITGICADLEAIVKVVHAHNMALFVDQAWGIHFSFSPLLPTDAMDAGADISSASMHKRMPALTGAAVLRVNGGRIDPASVVRAIGNTQTTSPSSLILASMDAARRDTAQYGPIEYERLVDRLDLLRRKLALLPQLTMLPERIHHGRETFTVDPTNLTFRINALPTGYSLSRELRRYGISAPLVEEGCVSLHLAMRSDSSLLEHIFDALANITKYFQMLRFTPRKKIAIPPSNLVLTPRNASHNYERRELPLSKSVGRVSAGTIAAYPPAVPIVGPGERITDGHLEAILEYSQRGAELLGLSPESTVLIIPDI